MNGPLKGTGAYAAILLADKIIISEKAVLETGATNNTMELKALITALNMILQSFDKQDEKYRINVFSDSKYVCNIYNSWLRTWILAKTLDQKANKELLLELNELKKYLKEKNIFVNLCHIRGHQGNVFNEHVDSLCTQAMYPITKRSKKLKLVSQKEQFYLSQELVELI